MGGLKRLLEAVRGRPPSRAAARLEREGSEIWIGGEPYQTTLLQVHKALRPRTYFEIGTLSGNTLALAECTSVAVGPALQLALDPARNKPLCILRETTSDEFFERDDLRRLLGGAVDIAFLAGMHHFDFLLRDFINTERCSHSRTVVFLHNCCPRDAFMTRRMEHLHEEGETTYPGFWTGDAWKMVPVLRQMRPDLDVACLDANPTGLVAIRGLNPLNRILPDGIDDILKEWEPVTLAEYGLPRLFADCRLESAEAWRRSLKPLAS